MSEKNESQKFPPPIKEGESIIEYSIRISGDKRTPDQIKNDSLKAGKEVSKKAPEEKDNNKT